MKYSSGELVNLGDKVALGDGETGEIVCSLDTCEFSPQFPRSEWEYLKNGVLINFPRYGLIHYQHAEPELKFLARTSARLEK